jgi:hypothetical protein
MYKYLKVKDLSFNSQDHAGPRGIHHGYLNRTAGIRDQADELI